jgi:hypothetical protein
MVRYRFHSDGTHFCLTFTVVVWLSVFVSEAACEFIVDSLDFCHPYKGLRTNAYLIIPMPTTFARALSISPCIGGSRARDTGRRAAPSRGRCCWH